MTGQTISHYRILEKLGEGGMGVVYKAEDTKLRRTVALKFLPPHADEHSDRFLREAQAAASLNHPHICTIYEIDEEHGFIAMEMIEGPSLKQKIAERPLKLDEAIGLATQILKGLGAAHEKGVVHRDIKPANILLTAQGQAKITDFGLAALTDRTRITKTGMSLGTPAYMSPEQARGEETDRRTDIWSLGVVLYEMFSGRTPFGGTHDAALAYGIVHTEPEPLTSLRAGLPLELDRIISKSLAKSASERYQHAEDLVVDLQRLSRPSIVGMPMRKKPAVSGRMLALLISTAIGVGGAASWVLWRNWPAKTTVTEPVQFRAGNPPSVVPEANEYYRMAITHQSDFARIRSLLRKAIALDPKFATARAEYALFTFLEFLDGFSDDPSVLFEAEQQLQQAFRDNPKSGRAHAVLGAVYLMQGKKEDAARELASAHALTPKDLDTINWRFNYHWMNGDSGEAEALARNMVAAAPGFIPGRMHLVNIVRERGDLQTALREVN